MSKKYGEINVPVVIVTGDQDKIVAPDQNAHVLHAAIPQSHLIEIKDTVTRSRRRIRRALKQLSG
jgi:pimeloyl-ACP methyl ester carboxylesterase